jgi:hypothetical protein
MAAGPFARFVAEVLLRAGATNAKKAHGMAVELINELNRQSRAMETELT